MSKHVLLVPALIMSAIVTGQSPVGDVPEGMALIKGGTFLMGSNANERYPSFPAHPVTVGSFYMDTREVTNSEYDAYCRATGHKYPEFWGMDIYKSGPGYPDHPVIGVSQYDAALYAEWAGKRLPTEAEWEYAARGGVEEMDYPHGEKADRALARFNDPHAEKGPVPVGSYEPNGYGLYDMSGNVWEWVADWFDAAYYSESPDRDPKGPGTGNFRVFRGGGWHSGPGCSMVHHRNALPRHCVDMAGGFRCVKDPDTNWPSYRGYLARGFLDHVNLPDSFDVETSYNVIWNIGIPGMGLSCPVIWDDRVYITSAISQEDREGYRTGRYGDIEPVKDSSEHAWMVYCIERSSGRILWEREAHRGIPGVKRHPKSSHANTTMATDGTRVVAFFGSEGLYCYHRDGSLLWKRDLGLIMSAWHVVESAEWEFCSSPVIFGGKVIIQVDALNIAYVAALDLETGKTIWKRERDEIPGWCTPNIYFDGDKARVAVNGYKHRGGYDLETGEEVWRMSGGGDIPIPTPVSWNDLIFFNSAHGRHAPLMAVRSNARGEIVYPGKEGEPDRRLAWFRDRAGAYMTSVLVYDSLLYMLRWNGNLACYDARSGEEIYQHTVDRTSFIASPVAADGLIYLVSEEGALYIVKAGRKFRMLKRIPLGEVSLVTPAITEGTLILRTATRLMAVSGN